MTDLLVVGLGNPGAQYARTRHNVGAEAVDLLAHRHGTTLSVSKQQARVARTGALLLAVPTTYMNESGVAVRKLADYYGYGADRIVVVHDELDLEPGVVKLKVGGGLAGNNGLRSIAAHLKTHEFVRVRIGIGKPPSKEAGASHVLNRVPKREREILDVAVEIAADAVEAIAAEGIAEATKRLHTRP